MNRRAVPFALVFVVVLYAALWLSVLLLPAVRDWSREPLFVRLPQLLFAAAAVLGLCFAQTRIAFLALFLALSGFLLRAAWFVTPAEPDKGVALVLLVTLGAPAVAAAFYRLTEHGLWSRFVVARMLAVAAALLLIFLLSLSPGFTRAVARSTPPTLRGGAGGWRLPGAGLLSLCLAVPILLWRKQGESRLLGPLLVASLVVFFTGLNFCPGPWSAARREATFTLFTAGAALVLITAVLQSVWEHMNQDELTELANRRAFRQRLRGLEPPYALALVDLDHFKAINDRYGHPVGDQVLRFVARALAQNASGTVYRYGGEEFAIVYETAGFESLLGELENLRELIAHKAFALRRPDRPARKPKQPVPAAPGSFATIAITVSAGVARSTAGTVKPHEVLAAADRALYRAKSAGRNRVCVAGD